MGNRNRSTITMTTLALAAGFTIAGCLATGTAPTTEKAAPIADEPPVHVAAAPAPASSAAPAPADGFVAGDYACIIEDYEPFRCVVSAGPDGALALEKMGGSQRFRGQAIRTAAGFDFEGTFYCPHGDCTDEVEGRFERGSDGIYRGMLRGDGDPSSPHRWKRRASTVPVALVHQPGGFGASVGGATYGGLTYAANRNGYFGGDLGPNPFGP